MEKITLEVPMMYGDHHVTEVRRTLLEIPGVVEVYASSAFQTVEVTYDPAKVNDLEIQLKLDEAGYLGEWSVPVELDTAAHRGNGDRTHLRHAAVFETARSSVGFAHIVPGATAGAGRPLWNCPGLGVIKGMED